jgi:hypothetical protein
MTTPQPIGYYAQYPNPGNRDAEHLRLLSIFHFVCGGLLMLFGCFPIIHIAMGIAMVMGKMQNAPREMGYLFIAMGIFFIAFMWGLGICVILSGKFLRERRNYMYSFVVAAISCLQAPFGTVLGVFTIIVLSRPSVKMMYGRAP